MVEHLVFYEKVLGLISSIPKKQTKPFNSWLSKEFKAWPQIENEDRLASVSEP